MLAPGLLLTLLLLAALAFAAPRAARLSRLGLAARAAFAALWLALTGLLALAFYDRYWRWRGCFNELGRCYDPEEGVMLEQAGELYGILTLIFGLLLIGSLWSLLRRRTTP